MNVMKKAHKLTREALAAAGCKGLNYRSLFIAALKDCHRINKAMQSAPKTTAQIYQEGKKAYLDSVEVDANPYHFGIMATVWEDGYYTAMQDNAIKEILSR